MRLARSLLEIGRHTELQVRHLHEKSQSSCRLLPLFASAVTLQQQSCMHALSHERMLSMRVCLGLQRFQQPLQTSWRMRGIHAMSARLRLVHALCRWRSAPRRVRVRQRVGGRREQVGARVCAPVPAGRMRRCLGRCWWPTWLLRKSRCKSSAPRKRAPSLPALLVRASAAHCDAETHRVQAKRATCASVLITTHE